ncbi:MAG: peptidoglycan DD-metalloendopeptidase family protein [Cryomorphaceae bacterium]|nr:peptidoglycan DD-metalloendopeptidase family protein [Cryomorphaceae bacterium]
MSRYRYKYNPEQLQYERVPLTWKDYVLITMKWIGIIAVVSFASIAVFNSFFESPIERDQKREIAFLEEQLNDMNKDVSQMQKVIHDLALRDDDIYRSIFGAAPYPQHLRTAGIGGIDREKNLRGYYHSDALIETKRMISQLQRKVVAQSKSYEELIELARSKEAMLSSIPAIQPVRNEDLTRMASGYGMRIHPIYKVPKMHTGMDFTAPEGTEIFASGDGVVIETDNKFNGYGTHVIIKHGYGYETLYAHMSKVNVRLGQKVKRGEVIGYVGNTGTSVGAHLHYEVIKNGEKVNPAYFYFNDLTPEQFEKLLEQSSIGNQSFD